MKFAYPLRFGFLLSTFAIFVSPLMGADVLTVGLTTSNVRIEATAVAGASASSRTVLLIGGLQGKDNTVDIVAREARDFEAMPQASRPFRLLAIPLANPDGQPLQFPPSGVAYKENIES